MIDFCENCCTLSSGSNKFGKSRRGIMAKVADIKDIGPRYAEKLHTVGILTTQALLKKGATSKGRKEIAEKTALSEKLILAWVNHVDLFRVKGVGIEYADLLELVGVDTIAELAQRVPEELHEVIVSNNVKKKLVRQLPSQEQIKHWVAQAKKLPRVITY
jgi:predicted flap endonuclease-1-like 5' DNA nuclease